MNGFVRVFRVLYRRAGLYQRLGIMARFVRDIVRRFFWRGYVRDSKRVIAAPRNARIKPDQLYKYEKKIYSQNGEDGVIEYLAKVIPFQKFFVEFGVGSGEECNCRLLKQSGWPGLMMDCNGDGKEIKKEFVTAENIKTLFEKYAVPRSSGVLSIDIDGNDLWVWKALPDDYQFDLVVIEYNSNLGFRASQTIPYQPDFKWDNTDYFGAGIAALEKLGREKGYRLVYADQCGVNLFFLNNKHAGLLAGMSVVKDIYMPPYFGQDTTGHKHDISGRRFVEY